MPNLNMTTESADHGDGLAFGFGLAQSGTTTIRKCFGILLFYFSTYYNTFTAGLVTSANILFVGFGFSVILSQPKTCARLCSYQCVGVDTTVRGRVGVPLRFMHFIPLHSNEALDFHLFIKIKHNQSSRFIEKVHTSIYESKSRSSPSRTRNASGFTMFLHFIT